MITVVEEMDPEDATVMLNGAGTMTQGGAPDAKALVKLVTSVKGKSEEELSTIKQLIPESMAKMRSFLRPLANCPETQLIDMMEAALELNKEKLESDEEHKRPLDPVLKGHSAFKALPLGNRLALVNAMRDSPELSDYHEFAAMGAEAVTNLSDEDITILLDDYNETDGHPTTSLWASTVSKSEAIATGAWICSLTEPLRTTSFVAGGLMMITSVIGFLVGLFTVNFWHSLLNIMVFFVGFTIVLIEVKSKMFRVFLRRTIEHSIPMIRNIEGRGYFYVWASTLCLVQWEPDNSQILNVISGLFMLLVAILNILIGMKGRYSLKVAHDIEPAWGGHLSNEQIVEQLGKAFIEADTYRTGLLGHDEIAALFETYFCSLSSFEVQAVIMLLDTASDGFVTKSDLTLWYMKGRYQEVEDFEVTIIEDDNETLIHTPTDGGDNGTELDKVWVAMQAHPPVISILATVGGLCLLGAGMVNFWSALIHFGKRDTAFAEVLASFYCCLIGFYAVVLENPKISQLEGMRLRIEAQISMFKFLWGRGLLYLSGSLLMLVQTQVSDSIRTAFIILGIYMGLVAIAAIVFGVRLQMSLDMLKDNIESEANLDEKWAAAKTDVNDEMDLETFPTFLQSLAPDDFEGEVLPEMEMHNALMELDIDNNGKISLEEFKVWYRHRMVIIPALLTKAESAGANSGEPASNLHLSTDETEKV